MVQETKHAFAVKAESRYYTEAIGAHHYTALQLGARKIARNRSETVIYTQDVDVHVRGRGRISEYRCGRATWSQTMVSSG